MTSTTTQADRHAHTKQQYLSSSKPFPSRTSQSIREKVMGTKESRDAHMRSKGTYEASPSKRHSHHSQYAHTEDFDDLVHGSAIGTTKYATHSTHAPNAPHSPPRRTLIVDAHRSSVRSDEVAKRFSKIQTEKDRRRFGYSDEQMRDRAQEAVADRDRERERLYRSARTSGQQSREREKAALHASSRRPAGSAFGRTTPTPARELHSITSSHRSSTHTPYARPTDYR